MPDARSTSAVLVVTVWRDADDQLRGRLRSRPLDGGEASSRAVLGVDGVIEGVRAWLQEVLAEPG